MSNGEAGRPPIPIDWMKIDEHLEAGCSGLKIASLLNIDRDTLYDRVREKYGMYFSEYSALKQTCGDDLIKKAQFDKAIGRSRAGDTTLLVHLGRVRLKQVEPPSEKEKELPPTEELLQLQDRYIQLEHKFNELMNAFKSKAESELHRSDRPLQCVGGSDLEREVSHCDAESH